MHDNTNLGKNREARDEIEVYAYVQVNRISTGRNLTLSKMLK